MATLEEFQSYVTAGLNDSDYDGSGDPSWMYPHSFHLNLPPHHMDDDDDGVQSIPYITKYAYKKARYVMKVLDALELTPEMLLKTEDEEDGEDMNGPTDMVVDSEGTTTEDSGPSSGDDDDDEVFEEENTQSVPIPTTLPAFMRLCARLQSQLSGLENLKHLGLSRLELCHIVLKALKLLMATYTISTDSETNEKSVEIQYEKVGYIYDGRTEKEILDLEPTPTSLEEALSTKDRRFAIPSPGREVLLSIVINIISNKGPLRCLSNAAIFPRLEDDDSAVKSPRFLLILHWRSFLRMLLRTAPFLDERKVGLAPMVSNSRAHTIVKRSVQLIRDARHFFDQGLDPSTDGTVQPCDDTTARQIWEMVKTDVMFHSHTHASYRSLVMLYLFQPSRCTPSYYAEMMPLWTDSWSNVDRCPEIDFIWLAMFTRARKHLPTDYDWGPIRRRLLTHSLYWLQLPIGGGTLDKSWPSAAVPRSRTCPARLKLFTGASSSYEEGIDFVAKVAKLLVIGLGSGSVGSNGMSEGTNDILRFLSFAAPYFNPSNLGSWTFTLGAFLHYASYEVCSRIGISASMECMKAEKPALAEALCQVEPSLKSVTIPPHEVVALIDSMLPLCQQALYSKNGHVGRAGEAAMLYLAQIDPPRVTPSFIDFATRALDISAVNLAHQAPAALSALTRLLQPSLRTDPRILLARIPNILPLTLAGIDSNDQNKTIRTLILYRSLTSWLPVGGSRKIWRPLLIDESNEDETSWDGTKTLGKNLHRFLHAPTKSQEYVDAIDRLPEKSLMKQGTATEDIDLDFLIEEASSAMSDWVLEFLDRVFSLLRASGEREKTGKTASGVASRHSSADVQLARNFSRVLKETLVQAFSSMDDEVHGLAVKSVARFLAEETLPEAAKDASFLCIAVCTGRLSSDGAVCSPGLDALVPILIDDLEHHSNKTLIYRLRCLAGAVRLCGTAILKHKSDLMKAISFALSKKEKHVYKIGCKLLRHTLATLCESYALSAGTAPRALAPDGTIQFGKSAQLHGDNIEWHVPNGDCIQFAWELLDRHVLSAISAIPTSKDTMDTSTGSRSDSSAEIDLQELRRCLRVIRYAIRGGAGIMLESDTGDNIVAGKGAMQMDADVENEGLDTSLFPYEVAILKIIKLAPEETYQSVLKTRGRLCYFVVNLINLIASETYAASDQSAQAVDSSDGSGPSSTPDRKYQGLISADSKVCKEVGDVSLLLLTRRGSAFRSQEGKTIWKAQKQLVTDFALLAQSDHLAESLQRSNLYGSCRTVYFKDGDDGGKTLPRRLLVSRVQLFHDSLQRTASFEVPKRLRRLSKMQKASRNILFSKESNIADLRKTIANIDAYDPPMALDCYEGIIDGLSSLCCHSNTQVRASAIGVIDYAITRFGWLLRLRVPRLLAAIKLQDSKMHGKFGIPSAAVVKDIVDSQGKRKRLAETIKGICALLAMPRAGKLMLENEKARFDFVTTICGPQDLVSLMPAEEMQKMVHYLHSIFSPFRLKFYSLPRTSKLNKKIHEDNLAYLLDILSNDKDSGDGEGDEKAAHWRKLLHACWFLTVFVDENDLEGTENATAIRLWKLCFQILEDEYGQPLQRVALGLFGRMVMLIKDGPRLDPLREKLRSESFCRILGKALVYDHREDTSVGGGHDAQWATGVADMIRDSARNIAPKSLFPFQRTNQSSQTFKVSHAQIVADILMSLDQTDAETSSKYLLAFCKEMAVSPPSEDQRNQQVTSAEIASGVLRAALLMLKGDDLTSFWSSSLIPYFDEVIPKIPISLSGAYFDCIRFAIQLLPPEKFYPLTSWLFDKIEDSLWRPGRSSELIDDSEEIEEEDAAGKSGSTTQKSDGFTAQSKWLFLCSALLVELDETELDQTLEESVRWYTKGLAIVEKEDNSAMDTESLKESWTLVSEKLLPRLLEALGHPYESCRDHISGCLFRICFCHRKMAIGTNSTGPSRTNSAIDLQSLDQHDPGSIIVKQLLSLENATYNSFKDRYNSLITARRFFSYCIHFGETKFEFSDFMIPLLPLAFEALKSTVDEDTDSTEPDTVAKRALEADVVKGFRYTISEVSVACVVSYGGTKGEADISRVLSTVEALVTHDKWQVRHACANFLRSFQGGHKFMFSESQAEKITTMVAGLLSDERREVSSAAMAAVTGIIAALPSETVGKLVEKYIKDANRSKMKGKKKGKKNAPPSEDVPMTDEEAEAKKAKEQKRARTQQSSVFFLCATILSQPYDTPAYVPKALASISKHSFERNAPLNIRDTVKKCCAEYKKTHMSDNWEVHRSMFTQEEMEALEDVVSTPHYYA